MSDSEWFVTLGACAEEREVLRARVIELEEQLAKRDAELSNALNERVTWTSRADRAMNRAEDAEEQVGQLREALQAMYDAPEDGPEALAAYRLAQAVLRKTASDAE